MIYIQYTDGCSVFEYMSYTYLQILNKKYDCRIIRNTDSIIFDENDIIILILNWYEPLIQRCKFNPKNKIFLFNIDTYINHKYQWELCQKLGSYFTQNVIILEYNPFNIKFFIENNKHKNIESLYLPFGYNTYYTNIFSKIEKKYKDIDVLFYGSLNDRRKRIIDEISKFCKVVHIHPFNNYEQQCEYILRSKIVINIYYYENNKVFDYFRMSNLLSNEIFTIYELPENIDLEIEKNLIDFDKYLICPKYDNIVEEVKKYLSVSEEERNAIALKSKEWFKLNTNFEENLLNLIDDIYYIRELNIEDYENYLELMYQFTNYEYKTNLEKFKRKLNNDNLKVFILINQNKIIGSGSIFKLEKLHNNSVGLIEDVIIDENFRGKSYGKKIIQHLKDYGIKNWGCYKVILNCIESNNVFYEKCGFEKCGVQFKIIN